MDVFYKNTLLFIFIAFVCGAVGFFSFGGFGSFIPFIGIILLSTTVFLIKNKIKLLKKELEIKTTGFSSLIENLYDGVIIYDPDFHVITINNATEKILNISKKDVEGKKIEPKNNEERLNLFLQVLFPSIAESATQISSGEVWPRVVEITTKEKKLITILSRVLHDNGAVSYFIKIVRDATGEKQIADDKSEFINVAAHQLRTPLTSLNWALESIIKEIGSSSETATSIATEALQMSERTLKIVNDLLDAAKFDENTGIGTLQKTEIAPFLRSLVASSEAFAKEKSITLSFLPIPPEWEGATIRMNQQQLGIACGNLIDNAIKYNTKNGEVNVRLEIFPEEKIIKVSIEDTGIGMSKKDVGQLFKKFFRGTNIQTIEPNGSGLGLYIVKKIIEQHGGKIEVSSREGRGSTFSLFFPLFEE